MTNKKIIVTGGLGFIGSNLSIYLARNGFEVTVVDLGPGSDSLRQHRFQKIQHEKEGFEEANINEEKVLERIFNTGANGGQLFHLAARAGVRDSFVNPTDYFKTNVIGSLNVFRAAKNAGIHRFYAASSSSVYGRADPNQPMNEVERIDSPISPYAASKVSMELAIRAFLDVEPMSVSFPRFFTVFGPRGRPDMATWDFTEKIIKNEEIQLFGGAKSYRDFRPVRDLVEKLLKLAKHEGDLPSVLNLGNAHPVSVLRFIELLGDELGKRPIVRYVDSKVGDVQITHSSTELQKSLGLLNIGQFLGSGVEDWVEWALKNQSLMNAS